MPEYRVDALAAAAGVTVDVVRSYQSKGLVPPPRHHGRVALYGSHHLERLRTIQDLKERGHSLRAIASMLAEPSPGRPPREQAGADDERLTVLGVAERGRVPPSLLRSLEASGLLRPLPAADDCYYTAADVRAVRMLTVVGGGVPLEEFMRVARTRIEAAATVAEAEALLREVAGRRVGAELPT